MANNKDKDVALTKVCPKCKEEINAQAKKCKHCGADLRNWFIRHKFISAILILIIISVLGSAGSDDTSIDTETDSQQEVVEIEEVTYKVGDVVEFDNLKITVLKVTNLGKVIDRGQYLDDITTQGVFVRVDFNVENISSEAKYMGEFEIIDSNDRVFTESDERFSILGDAAEFLDQLNPNVPSDYSSVFDVAEGAEGLNLQINASGLFDVDSILIDLELSL